MEQTDVGDDASASIAALASKQIDGLVFADPSAIRRPEGAAPSGLRVGTAETGVIRMRQEAKPFDDARVRKRR